MYFRELTERQNQIMEVIIENVGRHHCLPTLRKIGEILDIRSPNGVMCHITALAKKGFLKFDRDKIQTRENYDLGPKVPAALIINGKICVVNAKWRMGYSEAQELGERLLEMAAKFNDVETADTTDKSPALAVTEDPAPLVEQTVG